ARPEVAPARMSAGNGGIRPPGKSPESDPADVESVAAPFSRPEKSHETARTAGAFRPPQFSRAVARRRFSPPVAVADDHVVRRADHQSRTAADGGAAAACDATADGHPRRPRGAAVRTRLAARGRDARPR